MSITATEEPKVLPCPECDKHTVTVFDNGAEACTACDYTVPPFAKTDDAEPKKPAEGSGFMLGVADVRDEILRSAGCYVPEEGLKLRTMADVKAKPIAWLWKGRIPRGMLTLVVGDPGLGKSQMTLDFAARVSTGSAWPDGTPGDEPRVVFLLSAEDPAAEVLRPRLEAAGADLTRIRQIEAVVGKKDKVGAALTERHLSLETDLAYLEAALKTHTPSLIIIDPLNAYLGKADTFKDNHVRAILGPLAALAEKYGVAVVAVMHLNKDSSKSALYRAMGSVAFPAAARSSLMVSADPENSRVLLTAGKANLSKKALAMAFTVEEVILPQGIETSRVKWQADEFEMTADEATSLSQPQKPAKARDVAMEWLEETLTVGPVPSRQLSALAKVKGISPATLRRAREEVWVPSAPSTQ